MTVYEIYTKKVGDKWVTEPALLMTFYSFVAATDYLEQYAQGCANPLAKSLYKITIDNFLSGESNSFGLGAIRYCKVREV